MSTPSDVSDRDKRKSDTLDKIIHKLPGNGNNGQADELRVMTVRMPKKLHEALKDEARSRRTSANRLAVAKLSLKAEQLDKIAKLAKE